MTVLSGAALHVRAALHGAEAILLSSFLANIAAMEYKSNYSITSVFIAESMGLNLILRNFVPLSELSGSPMRNDSPNARGEVVNHTVQRLLAQPQAA